MTIPMRVLLVALQSIFRDRAEHPVTKRIAMANKAYRRASLCGLLAHTEKELCVVRVPADLAGLLMARATGHDEVVGDLRILLGTMDGELKAAIELLRPTNLLPRTDENPG